MDTLFLIGPRATIYNTKTHKVLLLQRNDGNNVWEIPGGKRENNEDIVDALKREVQEETGLIINEYKLVYVSPIFENHPVLKPFLNIGYLCFVDDSDVIISNEHLDYKWLSVEDLSNHLDKDIYNDLLNNGMIKDLESIKVFNEVNMLNCTIKLIRNGTEVEPKTIFDEIKSNCIYEIEYEDLSITREEINDEKNKTKVHNKLNPKSKIIDNISFNVGIYFILSSEKKLLYIGKSLDVKKRLKEHLIEKSESTSSSMFKINSYLRKKNQKFLYYYAIETTRNCNASIEGTLIDYAIKERENDSFFKDLLNERKD